jgi:hypothetical protein
VHNTVYSIEKGHVIFSLPMSNNCQTAHVCVVVCKMIHELFKTSYHIEFMTARLLVVVKALLEKDMSVVIQLI